MTSELVAALRGHGIYDVDDSDLARSLYASDASLYRIEPMVVVRPRDIEEVLAVHEVSRSLGVPITMRGAGTSIAGNAVGRGIVVDTKKHLRSITIDADAATATVAPGVVHADLQRAAAPHGLRFGPDPSTHPRCTIGGMIGNNACGSRALGYGRTADNVVGLTVLFGNGEIAHLGTEPLGATAQRLATLAEDNLGHIRTHFGTFNRQVSGYSLEHLLPERRHPAKFIAGSEGTLATIVSATVRLVPEVGVRHLVVLGYPSMAEAADAVPALLAAAPPGADGLIACEGLDKRIVDLVAARGTALPALPRGAGWLFVEVTDPALIDPVVAAGGALEHRIVTSAAEQATLWRIREDGAGLAARSLATPAYSGWEDSAVPPENLGAWLRDFDQIMAAHGVDGVPYGHFGDGCVHVRINFPFTPGGSSDVFRDFMTACATKLAEYGGSLSGEHGDGRARSELLPIMYDDTSMRLFGQVKQICDPDNLLNPGNLVDPDPFDADLRPVRPRAPLTPGLRLLHDHGSLADAVHRCTGVGKCVAPKSNGVMCPSYLATGDEKDSTRGRARVLQDVTTGALAFTDDAVADALDLCLACKGCASDCPTGVDMATYKSEALYQRYQHERRPRSHLMLGRLPKWARLAAPTAKLNNLALKVAPVAAAVKWMAGIDRRRSVPAFADRTLIRSTRDAEGTPDVWIWADSFTNHFFPGNGTAAIEFLAAHGLKVRVIEDQSCCGLTWITTGQLDQARRIVAENTANLARHVKTGIPVVALEPSCLATLRSDAVELSDSPDAVLVAESVLSFAELVTRLDLGLPDLTGVEVVAQPHCHQNAIIGWDADQALLAKAGATVTRVDGCCGLAGNFGVEKGHYEVSVAVAETHLLPAVRSHPDAVILADGMSCRVQLDDLADVPTMHLAELFASRVSGPMIATLP
ncbi:MAG: FAD-binding and (Fe-S)-binding domain-containing protein [Nocardioides sp.]